jgi:hypothetical protein
VLIDKALDRGYILSLLAANHHRRDGLIFHWPSDEGEQARPSPGGGRDNPSLPCERASRYPRPLHQSQRQRRRPLLRARTRTPALHTALPDQCPKRLLSSRAKHALNLERQHPEAVCLGFPSGQASPGRRSMTARSRYTTSVTRPETAPSELRPGPGSVDGSSSTAGYRTR